MNSFRYSNTRKDRSLYVFKVPCLGNIKLLKKFISLDDSIEFAASLMLAITIALKFSFRTLTAFLIHIDLNPDDTDKGKEHHKYESDEFIPVHITKLTYHPETNICFNFSLTLINLNLTLFARIAVISEGSTHSKICLFFYHN